MIKIILMITWGFWRILFQILQLEIKQIKSIVIIFISDWLKILSYN